MNCGLVCLNTLRQKLHSSRANELGYSLPVLSSSRECTLDLLKSVVDILVHRRHFWKLILCIRS